MNPSTAIIEIKPAELVRQSTDIAALCRDIVVNTSMTIQGRKFVRVEGWMSLATAHGCVASARDVERVQGGFRAIGEIRRLSDGFVISSAEGFVGEDEPTWFGGEIQTRNGSKILPKRPDYAIRAMAQTRAISRACRTAFAHVVVLMDAGLSTTPAEEVPDGGFDDQEERTTQREEASNAAAEIKDWRTVPIHFGKKQGVPVAKLDAASVKWYRDKMKAKAEGKDKYPASKDDLKLLAACEMALLELDPAKGTQSAHKPQRPEQAPAVDLRNHLKGLISFRDVTEEAFVAAAHTEGLNADVETIDSMTDEELARCVECVDEICGRAGK